MKTKNLAYIFAMLFSILFVFNSCEKEEDKVYTESQFYGVWEDENSTMYYCSNGTGYCLWDTGDEDWNTWSVSDNTLYVTYPTFSSTYKILDANSSSFTIENIGSGNTFHATKVSPNGCDFPEKISEGEGMFWVSSDFGCGNISVSVEFTYVGQITSNTTGGVPECGTSGCVTITAAPGTYFWTAECAQYTWSGEITISAGGCSTMQLTLAKSMKK